MIKQIQWGETFDPNGRCSYTHCIGTHPLGEFLITWKGWKDYPSYDVEQAPLEGLQQYGFNSLEEAKSETQLVLDKKINECLDMTLGQSIALGVQSSKTR